MKRNGETAEDRFEAAEVDYFGDADANERFAGKASCGKAVFGVEEGCVCAFFTGGRGGGGRVGDVVACAGVGTGGGLRSDC